MQVVICGAGLVGYNIAKFLIEENNDVTVVDNDPILVSSVNDTLDCRGLLGHASSPATLEKAGIENADMIIAVTRVDEINMMACQIAHTLFKVPRKLARIREQSYLAPKWRTMFANDAIPIDVIISPEKEVADAIIRRINANGAFDVMPLEKEEFIMVGARVKTDSIILNDTISKVLSTAEYEDLKMNVMTINSGGKVYLPDVDTVLHADDEVYFVCHKEQVKYCLALFGYEEKEFERVVIVGGGNIGTYLANEFEDKNTIMVEKDAKQSRKLAEKFPNNVVINGCSLDTDIMEEVNIGKNDVCISVTNNDETNLLTSLLARNSGAESVIGLANNPAYSALIAKLSVDVLVNPRKITASVFLKNIRYGVIKTSYPLYDNNAYILEVEVLKESELIGKQIQDIKLPKKCFVGLIIREDELMEITSDLELQAGDRVIISTELNNHKKVVEMFTPLQEFY
ncbi:MAG: Trk system potassium transporter TrkA [Alphaproteobacteria bacterium]